MAKTRKNINFSKQRDILNFRPKINFVEPDQIDEDTQSFLEQNKVDPNKVPTLDESKNNTQDLITQYKEIEDLCDIAQDRIDKRAKDLIIDLDPQQDSHILDAVRRHFNNPNKTNITYDDYKKCLAKTYQESEDKYFEIDPAEVALAASDPFRNTFGAMGMKSARPELDPKLQPIKPLDTKAFQDDGILQLFQLLEPLISTFVVKKIKEFL